MADDVTAVLSGALLDALGRAGLPAVPPSDVAWEVPRDPAHGDYATNVAMLLGKAHRRAPRQVAETILANLPEVAEIERAEVAGPGFLNVFLAPAYCRAGLVAAPGRGAALRRHTEGAGHRAMVEFVSANPTGPADGRSRAAGDPRGLRGPAFPGNGLRDDPRVLLQQRGPPDARSSASRSGRGTWSSAVGRRPFPEDGYQGDYIREIAAGLRERHGEALVGRGARRPLPADRRGGHLRRHPPHPRPAGASGFDVYSNEAALYTEGKVEGTLEALRDAGLVYEKDGAVWLRFSGIGRPQDRVLVKSTGEPTYRLPDIAYHREKLARGFDRVLNVQGADHIEEAKDVVAAIGALGLPADRIRYLIHQFVTITRGGVEVKMSTRRATYVTVDDLLDQVGSADVFRWFMVTRSPESHLNFDLDAAHGAGLAEEPRVLRPVRPRAGRERLQPRPGARRRRARRLERGRPGARWRRPRSSALAKTLLRFPHTVAGAARAFEPHRVAVYLYDLAAQLHAYHHLGTHTPAYADRAARGAGADSRPPRARAGGRPGHPERARPPGHLRPGVHVRRPGMIATRRLGRARHEFRFGTRELVVIGAVLLPDRRSRLRGRRPRGA